MSDARPGTGEGTREGFRVSAEIPIRFRPLADAEAARLAAEIEARPQAGDELPVPLLERLQALERKLDLVLHQLDPQHPQPLGSRDARTVGISASGLALAAKEALAVESAVLIELLLPGRVPREVRAVARVVRCQEKRGPEHENLLAFAFRAIHAEDREAIVRFGSDVQRSALRQRSGAREA